MKVSERLMTSPQKLTQMQYYWDKLCHFTPDKDKKKKLQKIFKNKNIKVHIQGNI